MTEEVKKKLRELADKGGDDALLPQVLLELVESAEKSGERAEEMSHQISEINGKLDGTQTQQEVATKAIQKTDGRLTELEKLAKRPIWQRIFGKK